MAYEDNTFFEILAGAGAAGYGRSPSRRRIYDEIMARMDAYLGEFEQHGTDNITVDMDE